MENREYFIEKDGLRIHCKLDLPNGQLAEGEKCPLLVLEHGLTGHMEERHILGVRDCALAIGFAVLRVELYGHGKSDGAFRNHTIMKWVDQMLYVIDYAAGLPFVTNLYLSGHSQGGLTTMLVGAMERDRLKAIIPLAPAVVLIDSARSGNLFGTEFDPEDIPDELAFGDGKCISGNYFRVAQTLPVEAAIDAFKKPVLIIHADTDEAVPVKYAYEAAERYENCTLVVIENDTHCYDNHLDQVEVAMAQFLTEMEKG